MPREHNKTLVELASIVPSANQQALHQFLHNAPWNTEALNRRRLQHWLAHPWLGPHAGGVLIVDETGDPKRGQRMALAAQHHLGKLGHVANGVVAMDTSHWTDGSRHAPLGVKPYRPESRLPEGRKDPAFHTQPQLAWGLIEEARAAGIPFRLVVADSVSGENTALEAQVFAAQIPYVMGLRPSHGTWQVVEDPAHPPAFTPAEAAQRLPRDAWQQTTCSDSHGKELVRSIAELEVGTAYGPTRGVRLVAATLDPVRLKPESTWYLVTSLPLAPVSAAQVSEIYRLRDGIEHFSKPVKHELGWADYQVRSERAIVRHWQLALLAYTFSLLVGAVPASVAPSVSPSPAQKATGGKNQGPTTHRARPAPAGASCGRRRCAGYGVGSAPGRSGNAPGDAGRATPHRPTWPRSSPTSHAPFRLTRLPPQPDQPATKRR